LARLVGFSIKMLGGLRKSFNSGCVIIGCGDEVVTSVGSLVKSVRRGITAKVSVIMFPSWDLSEAAVLKLLTTGVALYRICLVRGGSCVI